MTKSERNVYGMTHIHIKTKWGSMINANVMDAKGITNDLPLSLRISTEPTLF